MSDSLKDIIIAIISFIVGWLCSRFFPNKPKSK